MYLFTSLLLLFYIDFKSVHSNRIDKNDIWWDNQLYYQLNIKSFKDSDGDGIGDIRGVINGFDHLKSLKVDAIILSPLFKLENDCNQYGVADFFEIDPSLGTLNDFNELSTNAKKHGIKVILDLNLDETSTTSKWFQSSLNDSSQDLYIWRNDQVSDVRQIWYEDRKMYFDTVGYPGVEYPMLNYKSRKLIEHIKDVLRYWMERDVSAFRVHVKEEMMEDRNKMESFMILKNYIDFYSRNYGDEVKGLIAEFDQDAQIILKKEFIENCFHFIFMNSFINDLNHDSTAKDVKFSIEKMIIYSSGIQSPIWMMKTSKNARLSSYFGIENAENAIFAAFLLPGSIAINQGDEIGMFDAEFIAENVCKQFVENDHERLILQSSAPFQWDDTLNAGFSNNSKPWLPVANNYRNINLLKQKRVSQSVFKTYRDLANFRKSAIIKNGELITHTLSDGVLAFIRKAEVSESVLVLINFSAYVQSVDMNIFRELDDELVVIISSHQSKLKMGDKLIKDRIRLAGGEALVLMVNEKPCAGPKPVDKIMNKLAEAKQKISVFLNLD